MPKILVTAALPYANGPAHLGHLVEHIQTDIYVRYLRSARHDAVFLCTCWRACSSLLCPRSARLSSPN